MSSSSATSGTTFVRDDKLVRRANFAVATGITLLMIPLMIGIFAHLGATEQLPNSLSSIGCDGAIAIIALSLLCMIVAIIMRCKAIVDKPLEKKKEIVVDASKPTPEALKIEYAQKLAQLERGKYWEIGRTRPGTDIEDHVILIKNFDRETAIEVFTREESTAWQQRIENLKRHSLNPYVPPGSGGLYEDD